MENMYISGVVFPLDKRSTWWWSHLT